jgi:hypothetical protein
MSTTTHEAGPSRAELEMLMRAAVRAATPREHGRQQARRATGRLVAFLMMAAGTVGCYDLALLASGA